MTRVNRAGAVLTAALAVVIVVPLMALAWPRDDASTDPWAYVPDRLPKTDHTSLLAGPFEDGPAVTRACLECHEDAGEAMLRSAHFTWESPAVELEGRPEPVRLGKKTAVNNFCIGIGGNWPACTSCHAGYGWEDQSYDFTRVENVDCLACHDRSGGYAKGTAGRVAEGVDLVEAARSVGLPTRDNCGACHFNGGGGNAVKHGDLDGTLFFPSERLDVHMGRHDFLCTDCHQGEHDRMKGRAVSVSLDGANQAACADCHVGDVHGDARLNAHLDAVACQTCHIPEFAVDEATKMAWDWSAAGQDRPEDPHEYLKIKGSFEYGREVRPEYAWYNGEAHHYLLGDRMDPADTTVIVEPAGGIRDPRARIWPFKVHRGSQIYDVLNRYLIQPKTYGEGGYWTDFDWDQAARLGMEAVGLPYSGEYGFAPTRMYWPITHMVAPADRSLQCDACHGAGDRLDWTALGYSGDPLEVGGRAPGLRHAAAEGGSR